MFSLERDLSNGLFEREPYPMENAIPINVPMASTNGLKREPSQEPQDRARLLRDRLRHTLFGPRAEDATMTREPSPEPETTQQMLERLRHRLFRPPRT